MSAAVEKGFANWRTEKGPQPENTSGFHPTGHLLLLRGVQVQEIKQTDWGFQLKEETAEAERSKSVLMDVIEIGPGCWNDQAHDFCAVGDSVLIGQYVGKFHTSYLDGLEYRFVKDLDILTTVTVKTTEGEDNGS